jgi:hypothetical protein
MEGAVTLFEVIGIVQQRGPNQRRSHYKYRISPEPAGSVDILAINGLRPSLNGIVYNRSQKPKPR